jgi:hypothetical protein
MWRAEHRMKVREGQRTLNMKSMQSRESGEFEDRGSWKNVAELRGQEYLCFAFLMLPSLSQLQFTPIGESQQCDRTQFSCE